MNIGIDFDGVIADSSSLKKKYVFDNFGLDVKTSELAKKNLMAKIGEKEYYKMISEIYGTDIFYKARILPNAKKVINSLNKDSVFIVTSREDNEAYFAKNFLDLNKIKYDFFINTSNKDKNEVCISNNIELLVEDNENILLKIDKDKVRRVLFDTPYNRNVVLPEDVIRLRGWARFKYL